MAPGTAPGPALGEALAGLGRFSEAEPLILSGYEGVEARKETIGQTARRSTSGRRPGVWSGCTRLGTSPRRPLNGRRSWRWSASPSTPAGPAADPPPAPQDDIEGFLKAFGGGDRRAYYEAAAKIERRLNQGPDAEATARRLLERKADLVSEPGVERLLDELADQKKPVLAAQWLLAIVKARQTVRTYRKGHVVVGRLVVEDGRTDPELVMAQMPILPEGYFAGEVGDLVRPIAFRWHGYQNLDVPLEGKTGDVVDVGTVILNPLPKDSRPRSRERCIWTIPPRPERRRPG